MCGVEPALQYWLLLRSQEQFPPGLFMLIQRESWGRGVEHGLGGDSF